MRTFQAIKHSTSSWLLCFIFHKKTVFRLFLNPFQDCIFWSVVINAFKFSVPFKFFTSHHIPIRGFAHFFLLISILTQYFQMLAYKLEVETASCKLCFAKLLYKKTPFNKLQMQYFIMFHLIVRDKCLEFIEISTFLIINKEDNFPR